MEHCCCLNRLVFSIIDATLAVEYFCFFFSSRRRHTRFDCDWSSDVCSSDLVWTTQGPSTSSDNPTTDRPTPLGMTEHRVASHPSLTEGKIAAIGVHISRSVTSQDRKSVV